MNSIAVIVSTDDAREYLQFFLKWGPKVDWSHSILILVNSGENMQDDFFNLSVSTDLNIRYFQGVKCPLSKRNQGAKIAHDLGFQFVVFLNDYQKLEPEVIQLFLSQKRTEKLIVGRVISGNHVETLTDKGFVDNLSLSKKSSAGHKWEVFSKVSESGLIINAEYFLSLGGWSWPTRGQRPLVGGDGFLLMARTFVDGHIIGMCDEFVVTGGHLNPKSDLEIIRSKSAMYSYAFTVATLYPGIPRWLAIRFVLGRIFRMAQLGLAPIQFREHYPGIDISARLRAIFRIKPSKLSHQIAMRGLNTCIESGFACGKAPKSKCIFTPKM